MTKSTSASCSSIASSPPHARLAFALTTSLVALLLASPARGDDVRPEDSCTSARSRYVVAPGAATLHGLARCHEDQGKTASAWAEYLEAATIAHREKRAEIEIASKQRAKGLEPRLTKLVITVAAGADTEGLEVRRDGIAMDRAVWGSAVPVDPGPHVVIASAPGKGPWSRSVVAKPGASTTLVEVPALAAAAHEATAEAVGTTSLTSSELDVSGPPREPDASNRGGAQRAAGITLVGLGIAGVALGTYFGVQTMSKGDAAERACPSSPCSDKSAVELNEEAKRAGTIATVSFAAAGGALLAGAIVFFTAPKGGPRVSVSTAPSFAGVNVGGNF